MRDTSGPGDNHLDQSWEDIHRTQAVILARNHSRRLMADGRPRNLVYFIIHKQVAVTQVQVGLVPLVTRRILLPKHLIPEPNRRMWVLTRCNREAHQHKDPVHIVHKEGTNRRLQANPGRLQ